MEIKHKAYWAVKKCNMNLAQAGKERLLELKKLEELRLEARMLIRKDFRVGQKALAINEFAFSTFASSSCLIS